MLVAGCARQSAYSQADSWFEPGTMAQADRPDVFYIYSTNVLSANDESGEKSYRANLTDEDLMYMDMECAYVRDMFGSEFNFFAPYYHQFTMEAIGIEQDEFNATYKAVAEEVCEAFDYYFKHLGGGRKYVLAGFSQGAMLIIDLLKHMSDKQYSLLAGAYMMGYRLSEEDMQHPHIVAAEGAEGPGKVISFNSAMSADAIWPLVSEGAATCINPLNWKIDATPAELVYDGDSATVSVDPEHNVLIVSGLDPEKYRFSMLDPWCSSGNLHHWDLLFYGEAIRQNALLRTR